MSLRVWYLFRIPFSFCSEHLLQLCPGMNEMMLQEIIHSLFGCDDFMDEAMIWCRAIYVVAAATVRVAHDV